MTTIGYALVSVAMLLGSSSSAWAGPAAVAAGDPQCWRSEIDPQTRRIYSNADQWEADYQKLQTMTPPRPDFYTLLRAYQLTKQITPMTVKMRSDKTKHCYVGCRIAYAVDRDSADYAGWFKEDQDLTDCHRGTRFEWADYKATQDGIGLSELDPSGQDNPETAHKLCQQSCSKRFGR